MLIIKNLYKSFNKLNVLENINLKVNQGEVVTLIGPSGAGKSTLLRCINCLEIPEEGRIKIKNKRWNFNDLKGKDAFNIRKYSAMVFQNYNLFKNKTVLENVTEGLIKVQKIEKNKAIEKAKYYLDMVEMTDKLNEYPSRLSGGQQQRVGIARALATQAELLLFDEPTSSLDPQLVNGVLKIIKDLSSFDYTLLIVTHEMEFAKNISDRIIFMENGRIIEECNPKEMQGNETFRINEYINLE